MKKILALVLALAMTLALAACGGGTVSNPDGNAGNNSASTSGDASTGGDTATGDGESITLWTYPIAVSYTHLDVYKRQT